MSIHNNHPATNSRYLFDIVLLCLFLLGFYAIWLGSHNLFTPDEGRYSEVAREMIMSGDYITPRLNGVVFLDKPIMYYWLQTIAIKIFGLNEWALRLWPALLGILGCVLTYVAGYRCFSRRTGIIAAMILATAPLYFAAAHYANLDLEVAVFVSSALLFFMLALTTTGTKRNVLLYCAYAAAGLAVLTKGLIGIVFPVLIIGLWLIVTGRLSLLKELRIFSGAALFLLITAPWYILEQKANSQFFYLFFVVQHFSRFLSTQSFNNEMKVWFYIPIILLGLFPWTFFLIQALVDKTKKILKHKNHSTMELFLIIWFVVIFLFFSIPRSKIVGYILPVFPPLALLIASYLDSLWDGVKNRGYLLGVYGFITCSIGLAVLAIAFAFFSTKPILLILKPYLLLTALLLLSAGLLVWNFCKRSRVNKIFVLLAAVTVSLLLVASANTQLAVQNSIKPLVIELKKQLQPEDKVITYRKYYQDLPIYLDYKNHIIIVEDWKNAEIPFYDNWIREFWYGLPLQDTRAWMIDENAFWQLWFGPQRVFVFTDKANYEYLHLKTSCKTCGVFYKLGESNQIFLVSNKNA